MKKTSKVLVTVISIVIFIVLYAALVAVRGETGHSTPGIIGLVLLGGLIVALREVWKKSDDNEMEKK